MNARFKVKSGDTLEDAVEWVTYTEPVHTFRPCVSLGTALSP